jgi:hypothetical protein
MKKILFAVALASLLTGCATDHGAYLPVNTTVNNVEDMAGFVLLNQALQDSVTCTGIQEMRQPDGRLQLQVNIRNRKDRRIQVQADCVFKDAQGFVVEETPFENVFLDPNVQEGVRFVSANEKPLRYTIRIRPAW